MQLHTSVPPNLQITQQVIQRCFLGKSWIEQTADGEFSIVHWLVQTGDDVSWSQAELLRNFRKWMWSMVSVGGYYGFGFRYVQVCSLHTMRFTAKLHYLELDSPLPNPHVGLLPGLFSHKDYLSFISPKVQVCMDTIFKYFTCTVSNHIWYIHLPCVNVGAQYM